MAVNLNPSRISPFRFYGAHVYAEDLKETGELLNWAGSESTIEHLAGGVVGIQGWEAGSGAAPATLRMDLGDQPVATTVRRLSLEIKVPEEAVNLIPWVRHRTGFNDIHSVRVMVEGVQRSIWNLLDANSFLLDPGPPIARSVIGFGEKHVEFEFYRGNPVFAVWQPLAWGLYVERPGASGLRAPAPL